MKRVKRQHQKEVWKRIPDFPEYEASTLGRIRQGQTLIHPSLWNPSLISVAKKRRAIAYWILITFKGPPPLPYGKRKGCSLARHLNDNRSNNELTNLAWGTQKENIADAYRNGKIRFTKERRAKQGKTWRGKCRPAQTKAKIAATLKGHEVTPETRAKIAATLRARWKSVPKQIRAKMIEQLQQAQRIRWAS